METPSSMSSLPRELVKEILGRVASSSFVDLYSARLSCKDFYQISEEDHIYKRISLDRFPVVQWRQNERVSNFINECRRNKNPEALFRKGVVDYFGGKNLENALECLEDAAKLGHAEAAYTVAIISLFNGDDSKQKGIRLLSGMKKSKIQKRKAKDCRQRLQSMLRMMWVTNAQILSSRPTCCTMQHEKRRRNGWSSDEMDEDDHNTCDGCTCDEEIHVVFNP